MSSQAGNVLSLFRFGQIDAAVNPGASGGVGADRTQNWESLAASALQWWSDAGVDTLVEESPRDWFAKAVAAPAPPQIEVARPTVAALPESLEAFVAWRAGAHAPEASWGALCTVAEGDPASPWMFVVDCPDGDSILEGANGRVFDRMLAAIGLDRASVYLAPLAIARPLAGTIPRDALAGLGPLLRHHVALAAPKRLLVMGQAANRALLGSDRETQRGSLHAVNLNGASISAVASLSPAGLIRQPAAKAECWKGLQLLIGTKP
jgi:DNA polymerase